MSESNELPTIIVSNGPRKSSAEIAETYQRDRAHRAYRSGLLSLLCGCALMVAMVVFYAVALSHGRLPIGILPIGICVGSVSLIVRGLPKMASSGDDLRSVEVLQVEDPEIQKAQINRLIEAMKR